MLRAKYENAYLAARELLFHRGKNVGRPWTDSAGLRTCPVDGASLTDFELLAEAWGQVFAAEISRESPSPSFSCGECDRLFEEYEILSEACIQVSGGHIAAESDSSSIASLETAFRSLEDARQVLKDHIATHYADGSAAAC